MKDKRMIFAEDLIESLRDDPSINGTNFRKLKQHIEEVPDAVKHGHWIVHCSVGGRQSLARTYVECSECHVCGSPQWKVCPVCEAKMDGGAEDGK